MRADFAAILDANVLAESSVSDLFLRLSEEPRLLLPRWSEDIWHETRRVLIEKLGWEARLADERIRAAKEAFPEAMVADYEPFIDRCDNDPRDRHILAAAIRSQTETIVTMNARHFRADHLRPWGISAAHPGEYLKVLYDLDEGVVTRVLHQMAEKRKYGIDRMLSRLSVSVAAFVDHVAVDLGIEVPPYTPLRVRQYSNSARSTRQTARLPPNPRVADRHS